MFQKLFYHVFSVLFDYRKVWPNTKIFLCLWHVRKVYQKQAYLKIKDVLVWAKVLKNMGCIMHDGKTPLEFAKEELLKLMETIPNAQAFSSYVISKWMPKCEM